MPIPLMSALLQLQTVIRRTPRALGLLAVSAIILFALTGFSFWLSQKALRDAEIATNLNKFNADLTKLLQNLRTAESSQRGFLLTSDNIFLQPYQRLYQDLMPSVKRLQEEIPEGIEAGGRLAAIEAALTNKLHEMQATIDTASAGQVSDAYKRVANRDGLNLTQQIEDTAGTIENETLQRLSLNEARSLQLQKTKVVTDAIGAVLILSFAFASMRLLLQSNASMRKAQAALFNANADLENQVIQRTAALTRANEEIQRFAYIVSHDLRSPLVNIMGFTSELESLRKDLFVKLEEANAMAGVDAIGKDFDEALGFIKSSIARMERLIAAILRISREGNRPLNPETIDMKAMLETIVSAHAHQIKEKRIDLEIGNVPSLVADRLAVEQIFSNLIENAAKYMKAGEDGSIRVNGYIERQNAIFEVIDNGRGIDPRDHERIFELFRRSGPQTVPGEGMGLAFVTALVRRLGGKIQVRSALGEGSTFVVTLPRLAAKSTRLAA